MPENLIARFDRLPITNIVRVSILILTLAAIIEGIDIGVVGGTVLILKKLWALNPSTVGILGVSGNVGVVVGLIPAGRLMDRFGRKRMLVAGLLCFGFFTLITFGVNSLSLLLVTRFLAGLGEGAVFPLPYIMLSELVRPTRRGTVVGIQNGILLASYSMPSLLAAWALSRFPGSYAWHVLYLVGALALIMAIPTSLWLPESPRWLISHGHLDEAGRLLQRQEASVGLAPDLTLRTEVPLLEQRAVRPRLLVSKGYVGRSIVFWTIAIATLLIFYVVSIYAPTLLVERGFGAVKSLVLTSLMIGMGTIGEFVEGYVSDVWGRKKTLTLYIAVSVFGLLVLAINPAISWIVAIGGLVGGGFFGLGLAPAEKLYGAEQYPTDIRGIGASTGEAIGRFASGILAVFFVPLLISVGGVGLVYWIMTAVAAIALVVFVLFGRETAKQNLEVVSTVSLAVEAASAPTA